MITIIALLGKTSSGKDTAARYIKEKYGIEPVVSYATRPKRDGEIDGREHYFVSDETMDEITSDKDSLLAFVQFPKTGYRYCASTKDLDDGDVKTYIIDPSGLEWLKQNRPDVKVVSVYFKLPEDIIRERALKRGDDPADIEKRLDSERTMFSEFENAGEYDIEICTDDTPENIQTKLDEFLEKMHV